MPARKKTSSPKDSTTKLGWRQLPIRNVSQHSAAKPGYLAPQGMAGFVLANGSMSSNQSGEKETWLQS